MLRVMPPWLQRLVGGAITKGLGTSVDTEQNRNVDGVNLRFPGGDVSNVAPIVPTALGPIGAERRIIRGPAESDASYAERLRAWWDSHATRGGPYALLTQLFPYFRDLFLVPIEVVGNTGIRTLLDTGGNITRDRILWGGSPTSLADGTNKWARIWIMFNLSGTTIDVPLLDSGGVPVTTEAGEVILVTISIFALTAADKELLCAVPREWSAAHIDSVRVILLYPGAELWGYRTTDDPGSLKTIGTWADNDPSPGQVWQATDPIDILC